MRLHRLGILLACLMLIQAGAGAEPTRHGDVEFPRDEHQHLLGWDYWWGAADLTMESGNRYTVGIAFVSFNGVGATGHQIFPHQGPYEGLSILTMDGPTEWGHPEQPGRFIRDISVYVPGVSELLRYSTLDAADGLKDIGRWERTSLDSESYRLRIDNDEAEVHPTGERVTAVVDLHADMQSPPLLAGGTGTWWYGIPQTFGYRSRSFQYMQAAEKLTGTLDLQQPDGSVLQETVVPASSRLVMIHEYDASPEDLPIGLALAEATQLHPRYVQYYQSGMPWELLFLQLDNGAQLMVALLAFHETQDGTLTPVVGPDQPTYRVLATLRTPDGVSVPLDDVIHVEHLSYRSLVGRVPTFNTTATGVWTQAWTFRVGFRGGEVTGPDGAVVFVPPFDLGIVPQLAADEPALDERGNGMTQRVALDARGSYGDCPVGGFGWSELIVNWYGYEDRDPWYTDGALPPVPSGCGSPFPAPPEGSPGDLTPPARPLLPPNLLLQGCGAFNPGPTPTCEYVAEGPGGVGGNSSEPGGWTVTIERPGRPEPIVITGLGGFEIYGCGAVRPGDHVVVSTQPGASAFAGNPGICI